MQPRYLTALFYSVVLHGLLLVPLAFSTVWRPASQASPPPLAIQAAVVDESMIEAELARLEEADERRREAEAQRQRELDEQARRAREEREKEQRRLAQLETERKAAEKRQQELARQREQEEAAQRQARAEAEKKRLAELEQARIEEERRQAEAAEQRQKEAAARRKAEQEAAIRAESVEQLRRAVAEEAARLDAEEAGLLDEYRTLIAQRIERNWIQPSGAGTGLKCEILLTQIPGGEVTDVQIVSCNGDAAVARSIEAAVYKASPLPPPSDPRLFDRKVRVLFEPED